MILQALNEYYHRQQAAEPGSLPAKGFEKKEIHFLIVLDEDGNFRDLQDIRVEGKGKPRGRLTLVPQAVKRSSGIAANLLWDNVGYVLGYDAKGKPDRAEQQMQAFKERICELAEAAQGNDQGLDALLCFYERIPLTPIQAHPNWTTLLDSNGNISFRLEDDSALICQRPAVKAAIEAVADTESGESGRCLVTGEQDTIARLHWPIKGVYGSKTTGGDIVSFNLAPFSSHGRKQGDNAPVGSRAAFAYTTALNYLLRHGSEQRLVLSDTTLVFWSEKQNVVEDIFGGTFSDDPARYTQAIQTLFAAPWRGVAPDPSTQSRFYILGLAPSSARLMVRLWQVDTAANVGERLSRHFHDLELVHGPKESGNLPFRRLLNAVAAQGKGENVPPPLAAGTLRAIIAGQPYPRALLSAAVTRNRVEQHVPFARAALIKACINRNHSDNEKELEMSLDPDNTNIGYRLGRLFAMLEKVQLSTNPGLNSTIRDRFYSQASTAPSAAFSRLLRLKSHHVGKLAKDKPGLANFFEKTIGEIVDGITEIPPLLKLEDQGRFAVGYYHQRQHRSAGNGSATEDESVLQD